MNGYYGSRDMYLNYHKKSMLYIPLYRVRKCAMLYAYTKFHFLVVAFFFLEQVTASISVQEKNKTWNKTLSSRMLRKSPLLC